MCKACLEIRILRGEAQKGGGRQDKATEVGTDKETGKERSGRSAGNETGQLGQLRGNDPLKRTCGSNRSMSCPPRSGEIQLDFCD